MTYLGWQHARSLHEQQTNNATETSGDLNLNFLTSPPI